MSEKKRKKMIDKVRKLLALSSNNPNKHEAIDSALKAQEIMAQYEIQQHEVEDEVENEEIVTESSTPTQGTNGVKQTIASIIAVNFRCRMYIRLNVDRTRSYVFYGHESDTKIAVDVFNFIIENLYRLANEYIKMLRKNDCVTKGMKQSYINGFVDELRRKLEEQCTALKVVVPDDVSKEYEQFSRGFGKSRAKMPAISSRNAYESGARDCRNLVGSKLLE